MQRLGYTRYVAQGGDLGSAVTTTMGAQGAAGLAAVHVNLPFLVFPPPVEGELDTEELRAVEQLTTYDTVGSAYAKLQATRPQSLGQGLTDSPSGLAAWIYEKLGVWTDSDLDPESVLTRDEILDNITLYWLTRTAVSSARLYWESFTKDLLTTRLDLPTGVSVFPKEIFQTPRVWAERVYGNLIHFNNTIPRGGHFAAWEQPATFTDEVRTCFRGIR
jgi:pimeloyl-ACP methyl ester carboxylesterase